MIHLLLAATLTWHMPTMNAWPDGTPIPGYPLRDLWRCELWDQAPGDSAGHLLIAVRARYREGARATTSLDPAANWSLHRFWNVAVDTAGNRSKPGNVAMVPAYSEAWPWRVVHWLESPFTSTKTKLGP